MASCEKTLELVDTLKSRNTRNMLLIFYAVEVVVIQKTDGICLHKVFEYQIM
jgi:hypothetical protein